MPDYFELAYLEAQLLAVLETQKEIVLARKYHEGDQDVSIPVSAKNFLSMHSDNEFRLNVCRGVVEAVRVRLQLDGFGTSEQRAPDGSPMPQAIWADRVFDGNRLAIRQTDIHEAALVDREAFVIVDWDTETSLPKLTLNRRYTDLRIDGTGDGCWIIYRNDDPNQGAILAVKRWTENLILADNKAKYYQRQNVYYPDRTEKYYYSAGWKVYTEKEGDPWPIPNLRPDGTPRGIPVIHFKNAGMRPEAWDAIPMQDAINKTLVDILASNDLTAFKMFVVFGWIPTTDGKDLNAERTNAPKVGPAQFIGHSGKTPAEASLETIEGADNTPLLNALDKLILYTAQITGTPASRFITTAAVSSAETLKEQDRQLIEKVKDRRGVFGDAWSQVLEMCRKYSNDFGGEGLDESIKFFALWHDDQDAATLQEKQTLGVPTETIWSELGYSPDQIEVMRKSPEYLAKSETAIWQAVDAIMTTGVSFEIACSRMGFSDEQIAIFSRSQNSESIPQTGQ